MGIITPRLPKGMRDILPDKMGHRRYVLDIMEKTLAEFGFEPLITPAVELEEILLGKGGSESDRLMYSVQHEGGKEKLGLRFDLTVPLSRVVAAYPEIVKPFRRYQIAPVWRAERPQKGRYREFYQCDADVVGTKSMLADAEIVALIYTTLVRLGFRGFVTILNDRKILAGIGRNLGVAPDALPALYRSVDKLDKIGRDGVGEDLRGAGFAQSVIERVLTMVRPSEGQAMGLAELRSELRADAMAIEGIDEIEEVLSYLPALGVPAAAYRVDLSMVRGLDYYTGPIYETVVEEPRIGSITGGGRYDGLVGKFSSQGYPATGTTLGIERIMDVMEELDMFPANAGATQVQVLITVFGRDEMQPSLRMASELRTAGLRCEVYYGSDSLGNQIRYALKRNIPCVVISGPDEIQKNQVTLRDLRRQAQESVSRDDAIARLREWLA
jgi:histidyl-tRNA synthetase